MLARWRESLAGLAEIEEVINGPIRITPTSLLHILEREMIGQHTRRRSAPNIEMCSHNFGFPQHRELQAETLNVEVRRVGSPGYRTAGDSTLAPECGRSGCCERCFTYISNSANRVSLCFVSYASLLTSRFWYSTNSLKSASSCSLLKETRSPSCALDESDGSSLKSIGTLFG